MKWRDRRWI